MAVPIACRNPRALDFIYSFWDWFDEKPIARGVEICWYPGCERTEREVPVLGQSADISDICIGLMRVMSRRNAARIRWAERGQQSASSKVNQSGNRGFGQIGELEPQVSRIRGIAHCGLEVQDPRTDHAFEFTVEVLHSFG